MRARTLIAVALVAAFPFSISAAEHAAVRRALESIDAGQLRRHVDVLADDTFEGREAGSRGGRAAAGYIVGELQRHGLQPAGIDGGYFQSFGNGYRNILAMIEGRDPTVREQVILLGGHYDHVGYGTARNSYGPTGYIHNGADDNASGTAGLLELVEAFAGLPEPPRRTLLFAFWDGEEKGLLGSKHWAANPTIRLDKIALAVNLDMIGRLNGRKLEVHGTRTGFGMRQLVSRANEGIDLNLDFVWKLEANSDHYSFYERNVPVLMLHTGLHNDYHRPSDDAEKVNGDGMQQVTRLLFNVADQLAEGSTGKGFRSAASRETTGTSSSTATSRPLPGPRLGVAWKSDDRDGFVVTQVVAGTPAEVAGLQIGDRLQMFNGVPIESEQQFRIDVLAAAPLATLTVQREPDDEPREIAVRLAGHPSRLGITWSEDDAEPGSIILTSVVPGSASSVAGLATSDRVYEISHQRFANGDEFKELALSLPGPLEMLVERGGRVRRISLPVPPVVASAP